MRILLSALIFAFFIISGAGSTFAATGQVRPTVRPGPDLGVQFINLARIYREQGRYELARQAYAQAISTCQNSANLEIIKREMSGVELLIRTMR